MEVFIGTIMMFAGTFAPAGWAFCNGALLSINTNTALFSILGTTYGGDGVRNFALPNLTGAVPFHFGTTTGGQSYALGETGGSANVTLTVANMPAHSHLVQADPNGGGKTTPIGSYPGTISIAATEKIYSQAKSGLGTMASDMIQPSGGSQPVSNMQPYIAMNYIIALQGIYPPRS